MTCEGDGPDLGDHRFRLRPGETPSRRTPYGEAACALASDFPNPQPIPVGRKFGERTDP